MLIEMLVIAFVVFVLVVILIFMFTATLFKAIAKILGLLILIFIILAGIVFIDALNFKKSFPAESKSFYLVDKDSIIAGFKAKGNSFVYYKKEKLDEAEKLYREKDFDSMLENDYKLIIMKKEIFDDIENITIIKDLPFQKTDIDFLMSENNIEYVKEKLRKSYVTEESANQVINDLFANDSYVLKDWVFVSLIAEKTDKKPSFMIYEFKNGNIIYYKETPVFIMLKYIPKSVIEKFKLINYNTEKWD